MLDPIYLLFLVLTFSLVFISSLRVLHFIQLKEYRFDRLRTLIRYEGGLTKLNTFIGYIAFFVALYALLTSSLLIFGLSLLLSLANNLWIILRKGIYRFKPTGKAMLIYFLHWVALSLFFLESFTITKLNIIFLISTPLLLILTAFFAPITRLAKDLRIQKATQKLSQYPNLKVIGITGSYGKSSTKEFLYQILSQNTSVIKTPKNINTDIGVANFILKTDFSQAEIFIVEMGAYQKGEIAKISRMVEPDISLITAVHNQHLSLYGSQLNIAKAKYEIVENLKPNGLFIYCLDSPGMKYIQQFLQNNPIQAQSLTTDQNKEANYHLEEIKQISPNNLQFKLQETTFSAPIVGKHFASNLSLCVLVAQHLGLTNKQIQSFLDKTHLPENTFSIKKGTKSSVILDDSYNSSPAGFQAAISTAETYTDKFKILVTMGMLELGSDEAEEHQKIAIQADKTFDLVIVTSLKTYKYFQDYVKDEKLKYITDPAQLLKFMKVELPENAVILLENRVPASLKNYLFKS